MNAKKKRKRSIEEFTGAYDPDLPTYVVVHGWKSSSQSDTVQDIKDNYLSTRDANVIGKFCVQFMCKTNNHQYPIHRQALISSVVV